MAIDYSKHAELFKKDLQSPTQKQPSSATPSASTPPAPVKGGVFSRLAEVSRKGLQFGADVFVSPFARELQRPFVSMYRGVTGTEGPVETPFGPVKPYSEVKPKEALSGAFELASTVIPASKVSAGLSRIAAPVTSKISKVKSAILPGAARLASGISSEKVKILQEAPEAVRAAQKVLEGGDTAVPLFGETVYKAADEAYKTAQKAWETSKKTLVSKFGDTFPKRLPDFQDRVFSVLSDEGVKVTDKGVDLAGTGFSRNATAQKAFDDIVAIMREPVQEAGEIINKRVAITGILDEIPREAGSVRRLAKEAIKQFDELADEITEGGTSALRSEYAKVAEPTKKLLKSFTDTEGRFSMDKARAFVTRAMSDVRFDDANLLGRLDDVAGTKFMTEAKALGAARAIERLDPITQGRVLDVVKTYVIAKLPVVSALVSPRVWGEMILRNAEKAKPVIDATASVRDQFGELLIQNILTKLIGNTGQE